MYGRRTLSQLHNGIGHAVSDLLAAVEAAGIAGEEEMVGLEWVWLKTLEHTDRGAAALHRHLSHEPAAFVQAV